MKEKIIKALKERYSTAPHGAGVDLLIYNGDTLIEVVAKEEKKDQHVYVRVTDALSGKELYKDRTSFNEAKVMSLIEYVRIRYGK